MKTITLISTLILIGCKYKVNDYSAVEIKKNDSIGISKPYSNPANIYSSSFGSYFQSLARNGKVKLMLAFTSDSSKNQYGEDVISSYYKNRLRFDFILGKLSNIIEEHDTIKLTYANCNIYGTRRKVVLTCIIENDSVKLLLPNLDETPFY